VGRGSFQICPITAATGCKLLPASWRPCTWPSYLWNGVVWIPQNGTAGDHIVLRPWPCYVSFLKSDVHGPFAFVLPPQMRIHISETYLICGQGIFK